MPRNIEIKAHVEDINKHIALSKTIADQPVQFLHQEDVFFNCENGRLKLRKFPDAPAQLIFYQRTDQAGPKLCDYSIIEITSPESLQTTLEQAYGIKAIVKKQRQLFLTGRTRIHLDTVENLGDFIELEVVLGEDDSTLAGELEAQGLMKKLEIDKENLIEKAYIDLLIINDTN